MTDEQKKIKAKVEDVARIAIKVCHLNKTGDKMAEDALSLAVTSLKEWQEQVEDLVSPSFCIGYGAALQDIRNAFEHELRLASGEILDCDA